jgi:hypothetical protein
MTASRDAREVLIDGFLQTNGFAVVLLSGDAGTMAASAHVL